MGSDDTLNAEPGTGHERATAPGIETQMLRGALENSMFGAGSAVSLGRFSLLRRIGAGGMGVVYAAHDPDLDRQVAVKVLRSVGAGPAGTERLLREAQAMARLSHPHVVTVHEVGLEEGHVFVAMEYVNGGTLADLVGSRKGSVKHRFSHGLSLMRECAEGLAAAHAVGMVHRDFKPANVLLTEDGRALVADFGLAQFDSISTETASLEPGLDLTSGAGTDRLTLTGDVVGTPAYMAPEQLEGCADPRADQFSFCASFYEVFYGHRPFQGEHLAALMTNISEGTVAAAPASSTVPRWLRRVLLRGLSARPDDRYPDIPTLARALRLGERRRRVTGYAAAALGGAALLGAAWGGVLAYERHQFDTKVQACEAMGDAIEDVWNDDSRHALRAGLLAADLDSAESTVRRVMPWVDSQAEAWREKRTTVCLSNGVTQTWDESKLDKARWCLQLRRLELGSVVNGFADADKNAANRAIQIVVNMSSTDTCLDDASLAGMPQPPAAEQQAEVSAIREKLARVRFLSATGTYAEGLELAQVTYQEAEAFEWPSLVAAAGLQKSALLGDTGASAEAERVGTQAYMDAVRCQAWGTAFDAANLLAFEVGVRQTRFSEGALWSRHAAATLVHAGDLLGLREAASLANLGAIHHQMRDVDEALSLFERALALREEALGPEHPTVAMTLNDLGSVLDMNNDFESSMAMIRRALAIREKALGPSHPLVASSLNNLAVGHAKQGQLTEAGALFTRAMDINERNLGPENVRLVMALSNLGSIHDLLGEHAQAKQRFQRALRILDKGESVDQRQVGSILNNLATAHRNVGEYEEARPLLERALALQEEALGREHPDVALTLNGLGFVLCDLGEASLAVAHFERALAIASPEEHPSSVAASQHGMAVGLWRDGSARRHDRVQARQWAEKAQKGYAGLREVGVGGLAEVEALLVTMGS